ncbi:hypothetical protein NITLEN_11058 [Nitrospira lenta]|uniref:Tyr recombinase domain-containing protein n=1 Tax=Nitrospira lenta TaxID=1436998 RepID=A0A330L4X8_9BACT|nr:hypothetical protein NITLEN_11058 [Nitrospira lenta]
MNPRNLDQLDSIIEVYARQLDCQGKRSLGTVRSVWSCLREKLEQCVIDRAGRYILSDEQLTDLVKAFDQRYSSRAHQWLAKHTLNLILFKLEKEEVIETKYVKVPHQVPRTLVATLDGITPTMLAGARHIRRFLKNNRTLEPPGDWRWGIEVWKCLLFYTSVVLDSFILLPSLTQRLFSLQREDLKERDWILLPQRGRREEVDQGLRTLIRFSLTPSTTQHLKNLLRVVKLPKTRERNTRRRLFPDDWRTRKWRNRILRPAWEEFMTQLMRNTPFQAAEISMDSLVHVGTVLALTENLPPFAVAVHTAQTLVSPMTEASFNRLFLLKDWQGIENPRSQRPRVNPRQLASSYGSDGELFQQIELARQGLHREEPDARNIRREMACHIGQLVGVTERELATRPGDFTSLGYNTRCYGLWLIHLLMGKDDNGTVSTRASAIAAGFFPYCAEMPFHSWDKADWVSNVAGAMEEHATSHAKASFCRLDDFLVEVGLAPKLDIPWQAKALTKPLAQQPVPLVGPEEFDAALSATCSSVIPVEIRRLLRVKMILGFSLGLRSMEATNMKLKQFVVYPEPVIEIRVTKTAAGIRNLHLSKLMPVHHLKEVREFYEHRLRETCGNLEAPLLATPTHPEPYDSSYLASLAGLVLREVIAEPFCFHHLRHSFASWFLLRWLKAVKPCVFDGVKIPLFEHKIFHEPLLSGLRQLLFGLREPKIGEVAFSHGLVALCRLLGHSSPATTLSSYCHTVDVLSSLILRKGII